MYVFTVLVGVDSRNIQGLCDCEEMKYFLVVFDISYCKN